MFTHRAAKRDARTFILAIFASALAWTAYELARASFEYGQQPGSLSGREAFTRGPRQDAAPILPTGRIIGRHGLYFAGECGDEGKTSLDVPVLPYQKTPAYLGWTPETP